MKSRCRQGFTLIELVVVIVIIAILAAVAVPKFNDRTEGAREAANLQSLSTLRSASELFKADTGAYPAALNKELLNYLKGPFPAVRVGSTTSAAVKVVSSSPITSSDVDATGGWIYNATSGELRINHASLVDR
jgi:prepilin-type N-terminal cleavage/methylation domain-containing protein